MKSKTLITSIGIIGLLVILFSINPIIQNNKIKELERSGELISAEGIHWHPLLSIEIKGVKQEIPANIGIGPEYADTPLFNPSMGMSDIHTHDNDGTLHWEVAKGPVKKSDVTLGAFFLVWGKTFNQNCIFEYCNGPEGKVSFKVNGEDNPDFENYLVKDGDKIEIKYN